MALYNQAQSWQENLKRVKELAPVFLWIGEERELVRQGVKQLEEKFKAVYNLPDSQFRDFAFEKFYADAQDATSVIQAAETLPFVCPRKLIVVERIEAWKNDTREQLSEYLAQSDPASILALCWGEKPGQSVMGSDLAAICQKKGDVIKCWKPFENDRVRWIQTIAQSKGKKIHVDAAQLLSQETGETLMELECELEKLVLFAGENSEITRSDVQETLGFRRGKSVWDGLDLLQQGKIQSAAKIFNELLAQGEEPIALLALLTRSLRQMSVGGTVYSRDSKPTAVATLPEKSVQPIFKLISEIDLSLKSGGQKESAHFEQLFLTLKKAFSA